MDEPLIIDPWTFLDHKSGLGRAQGSFGTSWVPPDEHRRLNAYRALSAYTRNSARRLVANDQVEDRREYGEAGALASMILDAILGDEPTIQAAEPIADWVTEWAEAEQLIATLLIADELAVTLGDVAVLVMWDPVKERPTLSVIDPGFYFPTLTESGGFPREVRVAWEFESGGERFVRVRRWALRSIVDPDTGEPVSRVMPWGKVTETCVYWDGVWNLGDLRGTGPDGWAMLDPDRARWEIISLGGELRYADGVDLGIDWLPVVHIPNSLVPDDVHYGTSSLAPVLQGLDELAATDTDTATASSLVGTPLIATESGVASTAGKVRSYGPGQILEGKLSTLDMGDSLSGLTGLAEHLRDRVAVNAAVPQFALSAAVGTTGGVESGYALRMRRQSFIALIGRMRLARAPKWALIIKFAVRLAMQAGQVKGSTEPLPCAVVPSPVIPPDQGATVTQLVELFTAGVLSLESTVTGIIEALGLPIDAAEEVARIRSEDFAGALQLVDALGSVAAGAEYMGRPIPTP